MTETRASARAELRAAFACGWEPILAAPALRRMYARDLGRLAGAALEDGAEPCEGYLLAGERGGGRAHF